MKTVDALRSRLLAATKKANAHSMAKQASAPTAPGATETDPNDKGTVSAPVDGDADPSKMNLPASNTNDGTVQDHSQLLKVTKPEGTGDSATPAVIDGNAKDDAATSPTTSLDKIASLQGRLRNLYAPPAAADKAASAVVTSTSPTAGVANDAEGFNKLASMLDRYHRIFDILCATEKGAAFIEDAVRTQAGREAAEVMLKEAAEAAQECDALYAGLQHQHAVEQAYLEKAAAEQNAFANYFGGLTPEDQDTVVKVAHVHSTNIEGIEDPLEKMAYAQGAEDAAAMADGGDIAGAAPIEEEQPSPEELLQVLQMLVESGQITEEDAAQIAEIIASEGGAGAAPEAGMEEMPPGAEEVKQASELLAELCAA